jgi:hypothetical protein
LASLEVSVDERREALSLAAALPKDRESALRILAYVAELVSWQSGESKGCDNLDELSQRVGLASP